MLKMDSEIIYLTEESTRRIKFRVEAHSSQNDKTIQERFKCYGEVEYIYRRANDCIVCFTTAESAQRAYIEENVAGREITRPKPQRWEKTQMAPYLACNLCHKKVSGQPLNLKSHKQLCQTRCEQENRSTQGTSRQSRSRSRGRQGQQKVMEGARNKSQSRNAKIEEKKENSEMASIISSMVARIQKLEAETAKKPEKPCLVSLRKTLDEENERRMDVFLLTAKNMTDIKIASVFQLYGEIEYVYRRPPYIVICYEKVAVEEALRQCALAGLEVTKPATQTWKSGGSLPYEECPTCQKTVSRQPLNFQSHQRICQARKLEKKAAKKVSFKKPPLDDPRLERENELKRQLAEALSKLEQLESNSNPGKKE